MSDEQLEAKDLGEVVLHLKYMRREIRDTGEKVTELAGQMATRAELESVRTELNKKLDDLRTEMHARSASSTLERALALITRVGAAVAVILACGGGVVAIVRYFDTLKPPV